MTLPARYTRAAIVLHWTVAVFMIAAVVLGLVATVVPQASSRPLIDLHKSVGLTVFGLAVLRLLWRLSHPPPPMPASYGWAERAGAHVAHWSLYALIFLLPLSGYLHDSAFRLAAEHPLRLFWLVPVPRLHAILAMPAAAREQFHGRMFAVHVWLGFGLYAVFVAHVAGALKHQFMDHEPELQRMWPAPDAGSAKLRPAGTDVG